MASIDSSSLILAAKTSFLNRLITGLQENLLIGKKVYEESTSKEGMFDAKLIKKKVESGLIEKVEIKDIALYQKIVGDFNLGEGEAEAIVLCIEKNTGLITDDRKAMNACRILGIMFTTAANILIRLYKKGLVTKAEAETYAKKLERLGRYSSEVMQQIREDLKDEKDE